MNPIIYDFGIISIKWYQVFMFLALLIGGTYVIKESRKDGVTEDEIINLFFWLFPLSILGARLYYVFFNLEYYQNNLIEIIKIWNGGLAIHGGILFGLIIIFKFTKKRKLNTLKFLDISATALILGQSIGRWGNFFNQEAHGPEVTRVFLESIKIPEFIINGMNINGIYYHPTFLYESIICFIGFIIMLLLKRNKYLKIGQLTSFYLMWYGSFRFIIESLRTDSLMVGNFKSAQIVSIFMIIIGIIIWLISKRGTKFERLYNDSEVITKKDNIKIKPQEAMIYNQNNVIKEEKNNLNNVLNTSTSNNINTLDKTKETNNIDKKEEDKFKW